MTESGRTTYGTAQVRREEEKEESWMMPQEIHHSQATKAREVIWLGSEGNGRELPRD